MLGTGAPDDELGPIACWTVSSCHRPPSGSCSMATKAVRLIAKTTATRPPSTGSLDLLDDSCAGQISGSDTSSPVGTSVILDSIDFLFGLPSRRLQARVAASTLAASDTCPSQKARAPLLGPSERPVGALNIASSFGPT